MTSVESSHITARGYDPATGKMRVQFKGGKTYEGENVTPEEYEAFVNAESAGRHWHQKFKSNPEFSFIRIEETEEK